MRSLDRILDIIESAYRFEPTNDGWLSTVLAAVRPAFDHGYGCTAFFYDASEVRRFRVWGLVGRDGDPQPTMDAIAACTAEHVETNFRSRAFGLASESPVWREQPAAKLFRGTGANEVIFLNGLDPTGVGCFIAARVADSTRVSPLAKNVWRRTAVHVASGFRLQRRLAATTGATLDSASAVFTPSGRIEYADEGASGGVARSALRDAVVAIERARGRAHRKDPDGALHAWRGLVAARWSVVDCFDTDGRRYVVARENGPELRTPKKLTPRERQVVAYARMGHSNKLVAYELGISASTVGVLVSRAMAKLGAKSRAELFAAFDAVAREAEDDERRE